MNPKLEDVAKLAGVSKTTVSRVINKRGYLSEQTIAKVNEAIDTLNYQPNILAKQLFTKKTNIIGLVFPSVANPFFGELTEELEKRLYDLGFKVLVGNSMNDRHKEANYLQQVLSHQVDGLIVGTHNRGIEEYQNDALPIVAIDRVMNPDIPVIESDNYQGGKLATEMLVTKGIKKIIHTNGPEELETPAKRRREAYEDVMKREGLMSQTYVIEFSLSIEKKTEIIEQMFNEQPDVEGIFCSNDTDATLIMHIARSRGYRIPEDLKIIGYDGTQLVRHLVPELTTIIQPIAQIAETAVATLLARLNNQEIEKEYILPVSIWAGKTV